MARYLPKIRAGLQLMARAATKAECKREDCSSVIWPIRRKKKQTRLGDIRDSVKELVLRTTIFLAAYIFPIAPCIPETHLVHPVREKCLINRQLPERQQQHSRLAPRLSHVMRNGCYPRWNLTGVPKNIRRSVHGVYWGIPLSLLNVMKEGHANHVFRKLTTNFGII